MKRWLFHLSAAVSLLLFFTTVELWSRSHWVHPDVAAGVLLGWRSPTDVRPYRGGALMLLLDRGTMRIECNTLTLTEESRIAPYLQQPERRAQSYSTGRREPLPSTWPRALGFDWKAPHVETWSQPPQIVVRNWSAHLPCWFVCLFFMVLPGLWFKRRHIAARQRQRAAAGLCRKCGYDLRGARHERCPECGDQIQPSPSDHDSCRAIGAT